MASDGPEATIAALPVPMNDIQPTHHVANSVHISRTIEGATQIVLVDTTLDAGPTSNTPAFRLTRRSMDRTTRCSAMSGVGADNGVDAYAISEVAEHLTRGDDDAANGQRSGGIHRSLPKPRRQRHHRMGVHSHRFVVRNSQRSTCCPTPIRRSRPVRRSMAGYAFIDGLQSPGLASLE